MKKHLLNLSLWVVAMFTGIANVSAQTTYEIKGEQYPTQDWSHYEATFSYEEVAKAAGYESAAAMQEAIDAVTNPNSAESTSMFWCCDSTEQKALSNWNTQGGVGGFWHSADGSVVPYGNDISEKYKSVFFTQLITDVENDAFTYWIGQFPNRCEGNTTYTASIYLKNGDNTVTFNFELFVKKPVELPEATNSISKLNVIGKTDVTAEITYRVGTDISVNIADIIAASGIPSSEISPVIENMVMAWNFDPDATEGDCKTDTLMKYTQYGAFYFTEGNEDTHACSATTNDLVDAFILQDIYYDEETESLVASVNPTESDTKTGDVYTTALYVVYGDKAYQIDLTVNVVAPVVVKPEEFEKVGSDVLEIEREQSLGFTTTTCDIDVASIAELLGCEADQIVFMAKNLDEGIDDDYTATPEPGFWMNQEGINVGYGTSNTAWFALFDHSASTIDIGHMPGIFTGTGDEKCTGSLYFVYDKKLYELEVTMSIEQAVQIDVFTEVGSEDVLIQALANYNDYGIGTLSVDLDKIAELTGSTNLTFYVYDQPAEDSDELVFTNNYSAGAPGYWLTKEGYRDVWNTGNEYGIFFEAYNAGNFNWGHYPGKDPVGTTYTGKLFLVNPNNGYYYTINYTVEFVDEITEYAVVGSENIILPANEEDITYIPADLTAAMKALGIEDESLLESAVWKAQKSSISYTSDGYDEVNGGFPFDNNGNVLLDDSEGEEVLFYVGLNENNEFATYVLTTPEDGQAYTTKLALDYDEKRYVFNVSIVNEDTYTGISNVNADKVNAGNVYDISGRIVRKNAASVNGLAKGVYILNGKKYIVK